MRSILAIYHVDNFLVCTRFYHYATTFKSLLCWTPPATWTKLLTTARSYDMLVFWSPPRCIVSGRTAYANLKIDIALPPQTAELWSFSIKPKTKHMNMTRTNNVTNDTWWETCGKPFCCCRRRLLRFLAELQVLSLNNVLHIWILFKFNSGCTDHQQTRWNWTRLLTASPWQMWTQASEIAPTTWNKLSQLLYINCKPYTNQKTWNSVGTSPSSYLGILNLRLRTWWSAYADVGGRCGNPFRCCWRRLPTEILSRTLGAITPSCPAYPNTLQISLHASPHRQKTIWNWRKFSIQLTPISKTSQTFVTLALQTHSSPYARNR